MGEQAPFFHDGKASAEYELLLRRLEKAALAGEAEEELGRALVAGPFWRQLDEKGLMRFARFCQLAGRQELALEVLAWCNSRNPEFAKAWSERLEMLFVLDRLNDAAVVRQEAEAALGSAATDLPAVDPVFAPGEISQVGGMADEDLVCRPFVELRREEARVLRFMTLFQGREDAFARQWVDKEKGEQGYVPVRRPLQPADIEEHLHGRRTYGIYLLRDDETVRCAVIDIDLVPAMRRKDLSRDDREKLKREAGYLLSRLSRLASDDGYAPVAEFSGGKGYHLWFFFAQPVTASIARQALLALTARVRGDVSCFQLEVFPKQERLSGKGFGNLVKLPLGVHRGSGKQSYFLKAADRGIEAQLDYLATVMPADPARVEEAVTARRQTGTVVHPRIEKWAREYPDLAVLEERCAILGQVLASVRSARSLGLREEQILLSTIGHLPDGGRQLHHVFQNLPEYNRPLLDFKISRVRGTPLGCRRIHRLLDGGGEMLCRFSQNPGGYAHPLLHLPDWGEGPSAPRSERAENLRDAIAQLRTAVAALERFLPTGPDTAGE